MINYHKVSNHQTKAYPIPFSNSVTIEYINADQIFVYNSLGEMIKQQRLISGQSKVELDFASFSNGIYFYRIIKEGVIVETKKLVKN